MFVFSAFRVCKCWDCLCGQTEVFDDAKKYRNHCGVIIAKICWCCKQYQEVKNFFPLASSFKTTFLSHLTAYTRTDTMQPKACGHLTTTHAENWCHKSRSTQLHKMPLNAVHLQFLFTGQHENINVYKTSFMGTWFIMVGVEELE